MRRRQGISSPALHTQNDTLKETIQHAMPTHHRLGCLRWHLVALGGRLAQPGHEGLRRDRRPRPSAPGSALRCHRCGCRRCESAAGPPPSRPPAPGQPAPCIELAQRRRDRSDRPGAAARGLWESADRQALQARRQAHADMQHDRETMRTIIVCGENRLGGVVQ
eukprot:COSAG01_NODE_6191_length_3802_cov_3.617607_2_plen_164_part_00